MINMSNTSDIMSIELSMCDGKRRVFYKLGYDESWTGMYNDGGMIILCNDKYKILLKLPRHMDKEEWIKWIKTNAENIVNEFFKELYKFFPEKKQNNVSD